MMHLVEWGKNPFGLAVAWSALGEWQCPPSGWGSVLWGQGYVGRSRYNRERKKLLIVNWFRTFLSCFDMIL